MKAGRPTYHIAAKWITVTLPQGVLYFELDQRGNLARGFPEPHHMHHGRSPHMQIAETLTSLIPNLTLSPTISRTMPTRPETPVFTEPEATDCFSEDWDAEFDPDKFPDL
jgi:hypothetical protein